MCVTCSHLRRRDLHMPFFFFFFFFFGGGGGGGRGGEGDGRDKTLYSETGQCQFQRLYFSATKSPLVKVPVFHVTPDVGIVKTKYVGRDVRDHEKR